MIVPLVALLKIKPAGDEVNVPVTGPLVILLTPIVVVPLLQTVPPVKVTVGNGFTVTVTEVVAPAQLTPPVVLIAVTEIVPLIAEAVLFVATKLIGLLVPEAARPIAGLLLVQVNEVALVPDKVIDTVCPAQTTWFDG